MKNRITIEAAAPEDGTIEAVVAMPVTSPSATIVYFHGFGSSQDGDKAELFRNEALARRLGGRGESHVARAAATRRASGVCGPMLRWVSSPMTRHRLRRPALPGGHRSLTRELRDFHHGLLGFVSLDFQGHGRWGGSMLELTVSCCLADVSRVWQAVDSGEGPIYQIGSSMGGLVALWHAAQHPSRVFGQSVIAPALGIDEMMFEALGPERMANWEREGTLVVSNELSTFELGWAFVSDLGRFPVERLVELHSVSTLVFQGKLDDRVPWRRVSAFADSAAAKTRLELIDDGDHRLLDRMDWIVEEVFEHLGACNPRPRAVVQ